jgi:hypothetical protein
MWSFGAVYKIWRWGVRLLDLQLSFGFSIQDMVLYSTCACICILLAATHWQA